jgi:hypothetical protein
MFALNFFVYAFVVFIKYEKSRDENEKETEPGGSTPPRGVGPLLATPPGLFIPVPSFCCCSVPMLYLR